MESSHKLGLDLTFGERAIEVARAALESSAVLGLGPAAYGLQATHVVRNRIGQLMKSLEVDLPDDLFGNSEPEKIQQASEPQKLSPEIQAAIFMYLVQGKVVTAIETAIQADRVQNPTKANAGTGVYLAEAAGQEVIIVTDPKIRNETLKRRELRLKVTRDPRVGAIVGHPSSLSTDPDTAIWRQLRTITEDHIGRGALPRYDEVMREEIEKLLSGLKEGDMVDPFTLGRKFAVATMTNLLIGDSTSEEVPRLKDLLIECLSIIEEQGPRYLVTPISQIENEQKRDKVTQWTYPRLRKAFDTIEKVIQKLIEIEREAMGRGEPSGSFITTLLREGIDEKIIRNQFRTLALAGTATTAASIGWLLYSLGQNPEVFSKLQAEITQLIASQGGIDKIQEIDPQEPDGSMVKMDSTKPKELVYARAAIKETLLHYNPAAMISRVVMEDFEAGGYQFRKGQTVIFDTHVSTRGKFAQTLPFTPERFLTGLEGEEAEAYDPYGPGPGKCSGRKFGNKQILWFLTGLINAGIQLGSVSTTEISGEATMNPKGSCSMRVKRL